MLKRYQGLYASVAITIQVKALCLPLQNVSPTNHTVGESCLWFNVQHMLCTLICGLTLYDVVLLRYFLSWRGNGDEGRVHLDPTWSKCSFPVNVTGRVLSCNMLRAGFELITVKCVEAFEKWVKVTVLWRTDKKGVCVCLRVWADSQTYEKDSFFFVVFFLWWRSLSSI